MTTHEDNSRQYQPQDGSGKPDSEDRRTTGTLPAHPDPNDVDTPMASATQAQARLGVPPDENEDEIDDSRCDKEERDEKLQDIMGGSVQVS